MQLKNLEGEKKGVLPARDAYSFLGLTFVQVQYGWANFKIVVLLSKFERLFWKGVFGVDETFISEEFLVFPIAFCISTCLAIPGYTQPRKDHPSPGNTAPPQATPAQP